MTPRQRALALLADIAEGKLTVKHRGINDCWTPSGDIQFDVSDGSTVTVFFDVGEYDYVDSVTPSGGTKIRYDDLYPNLSCCLNGVNERKLAGVLFASIESSKP